MATLKEKLTELFNSFVISVKTIEKQRDSTTEQKSARIEDARNNFIKRLYVIGGQHDNTRNL